MKWTKRRWRIVKRFAWLPFRLNDDVRWLEFVYIDQHYQYGLTFLTTGWIDKKFVTREDYRTYKFLKKYNENRENRSK